MENTEQQTPEQQHQDTFGQMLGEIVWLMSQSPYHKGLFIYELEAMVFLPLSLKQFRIYRMEDRPAAAIFWAKVSDDVEERLKEGNVRMKPADWQSGEKYWVVDVIAPYGQAEKLVEDLHKKINPEGSLFYLKTSAQGEKEVVEVKADDEAQPSQ
ncbi:toxin-activating lysine-acyltransferase [Hydrogenovibrio sp. JE_KL2]|uniref:toxin-activating lysine-acyltransferase n=1 Tax=Hydrogenovibrio sp. JE_KL2 TaxID=2651188 RepID=UPI00128CFFCF|nr:toxin-activating lysine-acyltransferase [Hydrogenovibrio sp. JE_KL2]MPQ75942.1 toxin-activating lysine-acyltransferase [Hydrogenovibrio sp. JE_KL2]